MTRSEADDLKYGMFRSLIIIIVVNSAGLLLEVLADFGRMRNHLPRPIDIFASAGNLWVGSVIAVFAILVARVAFEISRVRGFNGKWLARFSRSSLRRRRVAITISVIVITALVNCTTETHWGVTHLPIAKTFGGMTPDPFDLIHSALWGGAVIMLPAARRIACLARDANVRAFTIYPH